jgi:hypothetical protein
MKKIDFSPPKETKVITPTTEIRRKEKVLSRSPKKKTRAKGENDHKVGAKTDSSSPHNRNETSGKETTPDESVKTLPTANTPARHGMNAFCPSKLVHMSPRAVSTISGALQMASPQRKGSPTQKLLTSPSKTVPPAAVTTPSRFQYIAPPALNLKKIFREANYHEDYPSSASTIDKEEDDRDVSACSPSQDGERDSHYDVSSPYKLHISIIEPTPLRQAKALEEDLLGHMHELESLTNKLLPFEQEQIDIQRRREDKKRQEEEIAMLEQSLQANKHQLKHQEENAIERILQLEERIQKLVQEAEQREGRSAEEIRTLKNNVHGLTIAIQEYNVIGKVTFGVFDSNHSAMPYIVFWNMIYWSLVRFPMHIVKTTLTWLIGLSLLGVVYSYLSPPEMLPSAVPHLDNVPGVF